MEFAAIGRVDLTEEAVARIRDAVLTGELAPGDELPSERELALQLGVNRTTVREALTRLELLGLIDRRHGKRSRVRDHRRSGGLALIPHLARLGTPQVDWSLLEAIAILYGGAAALAARRRDPEGARRVGEAASVVEQVVERVLTRDGSESEHPDREALDRAVVAADREFHRTVCSLSDSIALELLLNDFHRTLHSVLGAGGSARRTIARAISEVAASGRTLPHQRLAEAIAAGDEETARAIAELLATGGRQPPR